MDLQESKLKNCFEIEKDGADIVLPSTHIPAQYLLPKVLMHFNEKYPHEQIKIIETDSSQVVMRIVDHMVDVGFTGTVLEKKHCKYIPFYKDELVVVTPNTEKYQIEAEGGDGLSDISWMKEFHYA